MYLLICTTSMENRIIVLCTKSRLDKIKIDHVYFTIAGFQVEQWVDVIFPELIRVLAQCSVSPFDRKTPEKFISEEFAAENGIHAYSGLYAGASFGKIVEVTRQILNGLTLYNNPATHRIERGYVEINFRETFLALTSPERFSMNDNAIIYLSPGGMEIKKY